MTDVRPVLFEPASAIAAGICLTARTLADGRTARHPRPCGWCEYETVDLRSMVDGFNAWAGYVDGRGYLRFDAEKFQALTQREQAELVLAAQAFPEEPALPSAPPMAAPESPPAHDDEELPEWMRP